jgi:putative membrane protein
MLHTDARFGEAIERAVHEAEARTDCEIIVVAASRSGSYRDLALAVGAVDALAALVFLLFSPVAFSPIHIPFDLVLVLVLSTWVVDRSPRLLRLFATRKRKDRQVEEAAAAAFHQEAVHGTRGRTGVLVYVSALEDRVEVIPDAGVAARVPQGELNKVRWGPNPDGRTPGDLPQFLDGLKQLGAVLGTRIPALAHTPDEVANAPRIRT